MTDPSMLRWQYQEIIWELGELQRHGSDPNCPCVLADSGEYCLPKHALSLHGLARETIPMDARAQHKEMLEKLQEEALDYHEKLRDRIVCHKPHADEGNVAEWARSWRKKLEGIYYSCSQVKLKAEVPQQKITIRGSCSAGICALKVFDPVLAQIAAQISPKCSAGQREKLERCVLLVKEKNAEHGCKLSSGDGTQQCPNPWAVCAASIGCRW